ncbi:hypothetical protein NDU88_005599 [Pleurodeles waltl]|uniref:Uncharacterized protein n=1 Tax=Pleurodeles waltl TaxID=8319 RepID=A0AAV7LPK9_PLEWA|nr:hypothetical protein NDU88_005599 [Pleurodeles waltl]
MCNSWGVQGAGPDPLMEQIHPWPVVVVPQGLSRRGRRVSPLVSNRGGGTPLGPLLAPPLIRHCSLELPAPGGGGKLRLPMGGRGGGGTQGRTEAKYGLNALARWAALASAHPPLFQSSGRRPARHGRQNGSRSSPFRSAPRQLLRPAARTRPEPSARGERSQQRIPPQGCGSGAPGAPRRYLRGEPERSA